MGSNRKNIGEQSELSSGPFPLPQTTPQLASLADFFSFSTNEGPGPRLGVSVQGYPGS